jgi:hypothetical protein
MPDPQHGTPADGNAEALHGVTPEVLASAEARFARIHSAIVDDESIDELMQSGASNRAKKLFICREAKIDPSAFNLTYPFPVIEWFMSGDFRKTQAGFYVSVLRQRYFSALADQMIERVDSIDQAFAESEFWRERFNEKMYTQRTGLFLPQRVLH